MRFDHQPTPPAVHRTRGITYAALSQRSDGTPNDALETCTVEYFATTRVIELTRLTASFTLWQTQRPIRLIDVVDSPWVARCGGNAAISSGARGMSRQWSRAIYRQYKNVDGIYYGTSNAPALRSVALYERAAGALPSVPRVDLPIDDDSLRDALIRIGVTYDMPLVV